MKAPKEITEKRMNAALGYLAKTDESCAKAKALMEGKKKQEKTVIAVGFLNSTGTGQEKKAKSESSDEFHVWRGEYEAAVLDYNILLNRRTTATLLIEVWRSLNSNRRMAGGNL